MKDLTHEVPARKLPGYNIILYYNITIGNMQIYKDINYLVFNQAVCIYVVNGFHAFFTL